MPKKKRASRGNSLLKAIAKKRKERDLAQAMLDKFETALGGKPRKAPKRKTSKRKPKKKAAKRKAPKRKASKRKASKRKASKKPRGGKLTGAAKKAFLARMAKGRRKAARSR